MKTLNTPILTLTILSVLAFGWVQTGSAQNLVLDGTFMNTNFVSPQPGYPASAAGGELGYNITLNNWSSTGYTFLFGAGTADTVGVNGSYGNLQLWGSNNGGLNALTAPPLGGNFIAADNNFGSAPVQQTITGLTPGQEYTLSFYWQATQQAGFTGPTTENWAVSLGAQTHTTATYSLASQAASGWIQQSFTYTATGTSELLSFLANSTPSGEPPFSLLADVSLTPTATPEPTSAEYGALLLAIPLAGRARHLFRRKTQA